MTTSRETRIYAGAGRGEGNMQGKYRGGLYRRTPGNGGWQKIAGGLPDDVEVRTIVVHPRDPNVLFVGTQDGPYRSTDGGGQWKRLNFPDRGTVIWTMAVHP